jgi:hypothetical protein
LTDAREGKKGGRRSVKGRILKQFRDGRGYVRVGIHKEGKTLFCLVHRLVLEAFVGPCPDGMQCRHFPDRDPTNNRLGNLQWGTPGENQADRKIHGTNLRGKRARRRLEESVEIEIRKLYGRNSEDSHYKKGKVTQRELAVKYGVSLSLINHIVNARERRGK